MSSDGFDVHPEGQKQYPATRKNQQHKKTLYLLSFKHYFYKHTVCIWNNIWLNIQQILIQSNCYAHRQKIIFFNKGRYSLIVCIYTCNTTINSTKCTENIKYKGLKTKVYFLNWTKIVNQILVLQKYTVSTPERIWSVSFNTCTILRGIILFFLKNSGTENLSGHFELVMYGLKVKNEAYNNYSIGGLFSYVKYTRIQNQNKSFVSGLLVV